MEQPGAEGPEGGFERIEVPDLCNIWTAPATVIHHLSFCGPSPCNAAQFAEAKQLQRESAARLNGFIDELRSGGKVDLSAKNLGEEGTAYIAEGLAFNDR